MMAVKMENRDKVLLDADIREPLFGPGQYALLCRAFVYSHYSEPEKYYNNTIGLLQSVRIETAI